LATNILSSKGMRGQRIKKLRILRKQSGTEAIQSVSLIGVCV
jgi:hypothetical protein